MAIDARSDGDPQPRVALSWKDLLGQPLPRDHIVQPYRNDRALVDAVSFFAGSALGRGESVVLVATAGHIAEIERRLERDRFDVADLEQWGVLTMRDAAELLYGLMVDGLPDPVLFKTLAGRLIQTAAACSRRGKVRVFGEMVDLLWRHDLAAALRLEALWNELLDVHDISLLCAYHVDPDGQARRELPPAIVHSHSHLIPVEAIA
jgi:hypothetical protein